MEYTVKELAQLSGVSKRTLRYYDQIGLLPPGRVAANGYRLYGPQEVDLLQQILLYREMDMPLEGIARILHNPDYNRQQALKEHLCALAQKKERLDALMDNVQRTLQAMKGQGTMKDKDKFQGFKQNMVQQNEAKYGKEVRQKYGDSVVDASNQKVMDMSQEQLSEAEALKEKYEGMLKEALAEGNPQGEKAQAACVAHQQWLTHYWPKGTYTKEAHKGLGDMYALDDRFRAYYEALAPGMADFFRDALQEYCR